VEARSRRRRRVVDAHARWGHLANGPDPLVGGGGTFVTRRRETNPENVLTVTYLAVEFSGAKKLVSITTTTGGGDLRILVALSRSFVPTIFVASVSF